jgi:hypothetical protein
MLATVPEARPMQRYYFDFRDDQGLITDEEGVELEGLEAARLAALRGLPNPTRELNGADATEFAVEVRNAAGRPVLKASLILQIQPGGSE